MALARVEDITFHKLRHTFGTQMAAAGAPLRAIQEWMGHADAKTTEIYAHYAPDPSGGATFAERAFGAGGTLRDGDISELPIWIPSPADPTSRRYRAVRARLSRYERVAFSMVTLPPSIRRCPPVAHLQ